MEINEIKPGDKVTVEFKVAQLYTNTVSLHTKDGESYLFNREALEQPFEVREMMVHNSGVENAAQTKRIIGMWEGYYVAEGNVPSLWRYAKELPKEPEDGKVYESRDSECIYYKLGLTTAFGFNRASQYLGFLSNMKWHTPFKEFSLKSFEEMMIIEAEKRGFKAGIWVDRGELEFTDQSRIIYTMGSTITVEHDSNYFVIKLDRFVIFRNGVFAKIL